MKSTLMFGSLIASALLAPGFASARSASPITGHSDAVWSPTLGQYTDPFTFCARQNGLSLVYNNGCAAYMHWNTYDMPVDTPGNHTVTMYARVNGYSTTECRAVSANWDGSLYSVPAFVVNGSTIPATVQLPSTVPVPNAGYLWSECFVLSGDKLVSLNWT
jgi:hypothetical protein